jgi:hypothetical protein
MTSASVLPTSILYTKIKFSAVVVSFCDGKCPAEKYNRFDCS